MTAPQFKSQLCDCEPECPLWRASVMAERTYERAHQSWLEARFAYLRHLDELAAEGMAA